MSVVLPFKLIAEVQTQPIPLVATSATMTEINVNLTVLLKNFQ